MNKCSICGGTVMINVDSAVGTCDSCGNTTKIDAGTAAEYKNLLASAERRMKLSSEKGFREAIDILNDLTFVDGAGEMLRACSAGLAELEQKKLASAKANAQNEKNDSRLGIIITAAVIVVFLLAAAAVIFAVIRLARGEITKREMFIVIGIAAAAAAVFAVGKTRS